MTAMQSFFERIKQPEIQALYRDLDATWNRRVDELNAALAQAQLAPRMANLSTIWTVTYAQPCRYNWMLQFYLRAHGLALSWVGTGRFIFSLNYTASDFAEVQRRFLAAAQEMADDGWGWQNPGVTNKSIRRGVLREMLRHRFGL
jgi:glutamate-1-semialdehyde 2,1-aminomutase